MKVGFRKPSVKRSVKARTTGRVKRTLKKSVNPLYGKKGIGYVKNPQKAIYNKIYHKTTIDPLASVKHPNKSNNEFLRTNFAENPQNQPLNLPIVFFSLVGFIGLAYFTINYVSKDAFHPIALVISIVSIILMLILRRKQ